MGKKLCLSSLLFFRTKKPCCIFPKTHSFRSNEIFKTVNSIYFTLSDEEPTCRIRRLRSDRLFFDPSETSPSIMSKAEESDRPIKQSIAITVESDDPCRDFRVSMEEMVAANGVKEWGKLVELLVWFLGANGKENHGFIFGAFLELLVGIAASSGFSSSSSLSTSSSSFVSRSLEIEEC